MAVAAAAEGLRRPSLVVVASLAVLGLGLFAFRDLLAYDPFEAGRQGARELEDWFFRPAGVSPEIILGVALWFAYTRHRMLRAALARPGAGAFGWLFLLVAAPLYAWACYVQVSDLLLVSAVLTILGAGSLLGGRRGLRALLLPALFLLLLVPVPAVLVNAAVYPAQLATAKAASAILNAIGIESLALAELITTPDRLFRVIESCAGLGITANLLMSSIIYTELFYRTRLQSVLLVLLSLPVAMVTNLGRVLSIIFNPLSSIAEVHAAQGLVMVVVGVLLLALVDRLLTMVLPGPATEPGEASAARSGERGERLSPRQRLSRLAPVGGFFALLCVASILVKPWQPPPNKWRAASRIPFEVGDWTGKSLKVDPHLIGSAIPTSWTYREYERGGQSLRLFAADDDRLVRRSSLISPKTVLPDSGFSAIHREHRPLGPVADDAEVVLYQRGPERILVYHWTDGAEGIASEALRSFFGLERSSLRRDDRLRAWRVSTPIGPTVADLRAGDARLSEFVVYLEPFVREVRTPVGI